MGTLNHYMAYLKGLAERQRTELQRITNYLKIRDELTAAQESALKESIHLWDILADSLESSSYD